MAPHSSTLAWRIPWTEEPGRLQSMRSLRVGHDLATSLLLFTLMHWRRMATHSSVLAWRIPGTEEPGRRPSMGSHRVAHDWSDLAAAAPAATAVNRSNQHFPRRSDDPRLRSSPDAGTRAPPTPEPVHTRFTSTHRCRRQSSDWPSVTGRARRGPFGACAGS